MVVRKHIHLIDNKKASQLLTLVVRSSKCVYFEIPEANLLHTEIRKSGNVVDIQLLRIVK